MLHVEYEGIVFCCCLVFNQDNDWIFVVVFDTF